jgi:hypothetical protein
MAVAFPRPLLAEFITTKKLVAASNHSSRDALREFSKRSEVQEQMARYGLSQAEVDARLDALSDEEARDLQNSIDQAMAGGDGLSTVLGAVLLVFFVLLATDIIGVTKVFPFTRSIR